MKKQLLFSLAGGLLLFIWQFVSWGAVNFHADQQAYTPLETELLATIAESGLAPGMYALGQGDPAGGEEAKWADWADNFQGKPWAVINYQASNDDIFVSNLTRGFTIDLVVVFLLFSLLAKLNVPTLKDGVLICVGIGVLGFFAFPYSSFIWFKTPGIFAHLLDATVPWTLLGLVWWKMK